MVESALLPQHPGGLDGVAAHPEQVGGVQIHAHHGANGLPQTEQGLRVVHQLHPVVFQRDLTDAAVLRQRGHHRTGRTGRDEHGIDPASFQLRSGILVIQVDGLYQFFVQTVGRQDLPCVLL